MELDVSSSPKKEIAAIDQPSQPDRKSRTGIVPSTIDPRFPQTLEFDDEVTRPPVPITAVETSRVSRPGPANLPVTFVQGNTRETYPVPTTSSAMHQDARLGNASERSSLASELLDGGSDHSLRGAALGAWVGVETAINRVFEAGQSHLSGLGTRRTTHMSETPEAGSPVSSELAVSEGPQLGFWAKKDAKYADKLAEDGRNDIYKHWEQVTRDVDGLVEAGIPGSILDGVAGPTLRKIASHEATSILSVYGKTAKEPQGFFAAGVTKMTENVMPHKTEYAQRQRVARVAEVAGRQGVQNVVDLGLSANGGVDQAAATRDGRSWDAVETGLGVLGIEVHRDTLHGRFVIDGLDAATKIDKAAEFDEEVGTYNDPSLLGMHVAPDVAIRPGGEVKPFVATLFVRGDPGTRQLISIVPVGTQSAGNAPESTLAVEGVEIVPEVGEGIATVLRRGIKTGERDKGNGVQELTYKGIGGSLTQMVRDLCDPEHVGVRTNHLTPKGLTMLGSGATIYEAEVVENGTSTA